MRVHPIFDCALPRSCGMVALTLYPFILFAKTKEQSRTDFDRETLKHEMVHVRQARSYVLPPLFYLVYVYRFLREAVRWLVAHLSSRPLEDQDQSKPKLDNFWVEWYGAAYHANPFELEAYAEEEDDLTLLELEELLAVGAVNLRCLTRRELRRVCKLRGIPLPAGHQGSLSKLKLRRLLEQEEARTDHTKTKTKPS